MFGINPIRTNQTVPVSTENSSNEEKTEENTNLAENRKKRQWTPAREAAWEKCLEGRKKYMETKKIIVTENILKWTNRYKEETDVYLNFLMECTETADTHIRLSIVYEAFKKWFVTNNPKTHIPSNREFSSCIRKHKVIEKIRFGNTVGQGIKKMKLLNEYE